MNKIPLQFSGDVVPVFDKRDGAECEALQFKTWSDLGLAWNAYREISISDWRDHDKHLARLLRDCRAGGARVIAAAFHNFAVSVIVAA